jgi:hypothetical protein
VNPCSPPGQKDTKIRNFVAANLWLRKRATNPRIPRKIHHNLDVVEDPTFSRLHMGRCPKHFGIGDTPLGEVKLSLPHRLGNDMRASGNLLGLIMVVGIIYLIYTTQYARGPGGAGPPKQQIDVVGVRSDLLGLAQSQRLYFARFGAYATLDQLQRDGFTSVSGTGNRGYSYEAEVEGGRHFRITARPSDPLKEGWPTLSVDETMQVTQR